MTRDLNTTVRRPEPEIRLRVKLLALGVALVIGAGLCEIAARLIFPAPQDPGREPRILFETQPDMGFLHAPNQHAWMDDGFVTTNSIGLRGPEPVQPKPVGELRVLAVGDSTTFGLGVNDDETFVAKLESRLRTIVPGATAINGGISGYNAVLEASLVRHFAPILKPDVVLIGVFWNDLPYEQLTPDGAPLSAPSDSPTSLEAPSTSSASAPASAVKRTFRIGEPPSRLNRLLRSSRLLYVIRQKWLAWMYADPEAKNTVDWEMALLEGRQTPAIDTAWQTLERQLAEIRSLANDGGFDVGLVIMPIRAQVEHDYPQALYQSRCEAIARRLGFFVVDPLDRFRRQPDRTALFIPYDRMHYSAAGNIVLADAVFDVLRTRPSVRKDVDVTLSH
jgi:lysophospholipase L1-like esterase